MNAEEMKARTRQFALRILKLADSLPRTPSGRTLAGQIARSGTSVAANYRAAGKGRSKAEFIAKLGIAEEEADETQFWLELIIDSGIVPASRLELLLQEARTDSHHRRLTNLSVETQMKLAMGNGKLKMR
jgi:four helix bundle protein